jgi:hypothetical protein
MNSLLSLILLIVRLWVPIHDAVDCNVDGLYGYYDFQANELTICQYAHDVGEARETLAHEVIHVLQDINGGGIDNAELKPLLPEHIYHELRETPTGKEVMKDVELYPEALHHIEFEAWYFERLIK